MLPVHLQDHRLEGEQDIAAVVLIGKPVVVWPPHDGKSEPRMRVTDLSHENASGFIRQTNCRRTLAVVLPAKGGLFDAILERIDADRQFGTADAISPERP